MLNIGIGIGIQFGGSSIVASFNGDFSALFTTAGLTVVQDLRGDTGLSLTGSVVNAWADQSGNGANVAEVTTNLGIGAVTAGLNGHGGVAGNAGTMVGKFTLALPTPGTMPFMYWGVVRLVTAPGAQGFLVGDGGNSGDLYAQSAANLNMYNGGAVIGPVAAAAGSWGVLQARYSNSATDFVKFGSGAAALGNAGNFAPSATRGLFNQNAAGASPGAWEVVRLLTMKGPTAAYGSALASASTAAVSYYGASVNI